jgi:hypothetical protein
VVLACKESTQAENADPPSINADGCSDHAITVTVSFCRHVVRTIGEAGICMHVLHHLTEIRHSCGSSGITCLGPGVALFRNYFPVQLEDDLWSAGRTRGFLGVLAVLSTCLEGCPALSVCRPVGHAGASSTARMPRGCLPDRFSHTACTPPCKAHFWNNAIRS